MYRYGATSPPRDFKPTGARSSPLIGVAAAGHERSLDDYVQIVDNLGR
jgi:hypothetical protein